MLGPNGVVSDFATSKKKPRRTAQYQFPPLAFHHSRSIPNVNISGRLVNNRRLHMNASLIESRSLHIGMWGNLVMAIAGVVTAYLSRSDAILIDGLFSGVNFVSAIIAARVGAIVLMPSDRDHPWGYESYEALYVMFRSLVLVGVTRPSQRLDSRAERNGTGIIRRFRPR